MSVRDFKDNKNIKVKGIELEALHRSLKMLASLEVLVGIPEAETERNDNSQITNAAIGYLAEYGEPSTNLPARPWLVPGIRGNWGKIEGDMFKVGKLAASSRASPEAIKKALNVVGMGAVTYIKKRITDGLTPPLADVTLWNRIYKRKDQGAMWEMAWRMADASLADNQLAKPYIDTGAWLASIKYVVAQRRRKGA